DDPATVFQRFSDARNRGDVQGALAFVTDDIRFVGGPFCTGDRPCIGAAAVRQDMQQFIAMHVQLTGIGAPVVTGTTVHQRFEARGDTIRAAGVERVVTDLTVEVRDGKIVSYLEAPDTSDPQTARALAYQRSQQGPPSAPPRTGGGGEASFIHRLGDG
ncbi:MAG: nuclear transport factor 2 family protein, partial [Chloroflexota bacterium]|nr:nuclear transport factor 2 family protein [Chloroflexota bacterium]